MTLCAVEHQWFGRGVAGVCGLLVMVGAGTPQAGCHYVLGVWKMAGSWGWMDGCGGGKVRGGKMGDGWADVRVVQG